MENVFNRILDMYVSTDDFRPRLKTPFQMGKYAYATDAHSVVKIDACNADMSKYEYDNDSTPDIERILAELNDIPIQRISLQQLKNAIDKMPHLDIYSECEKCEGSGVWTCGECDHVHDCEKCGGMGNVLIGRVLIRIGNKHIYYREIGRIVQAMKILKIDSLDLFAENSAIIGLKHELLLIAIASTPLNSCYNDIVIDLDKHPQTLKTQAQS